MLGQHRYLLTRASHFVHLAKHQQLCLTRAVYETLPCQLRKLNLRRIQANGNDAL